MKPRFPQIAFYCVALFIILFSAAAQARTTVEGGALLNYVNYDAKADSGLTGKEVKYSGDSFAQTYSLSWNSTNRRSRQQVDYYDVTFGYDWLSFNTNISTANEDVNISDSFGKFRYSGSLGYNPATLPIRLHIYANDDRPAMLDTGYRVNELRRFEPMLHDGFYRSIEGYTKSENFGVSFIFDPALATTATLRGLPKLHLDYHENFNKSHSIKYQLDNSIKELSMAGLHKQNNWLQFKSINYQDHLNSFNNFEEQRFRIGHVDYQGKRLWSALTNWIEVSADGQFINRKGTAAYEEYDVNFMAIARRRSWSARTFMNYNRELSSDSYGSAPILTETARIPIYVKGIYGAETDWYTSVSAARGRRTLYNPVLYSEDSRSHSVTVGGTTFKYSNFTLSPALALSASNGYGSTDGEAYNMLASIETNSTSRFSRKLGLSARNAFRYADDGRDIDTSKSWDNTLSLKVNYRPGYNFIYEAREELQFGNDSPTGISRGNGSGRENYLKSATFGSISWNPNSQFSTAIEGHYELKQYESGAEETEARLYHRLNFNRKDATFNLNSRYTDKAARERNQEGWEFESTGTAQYRPDRHNDAYLRYIYTSREYNSNRHSKMNFLERYNYNFFTRKGVIRNIARLSEEIGYTSEDYGGRAYTTQYVSFSGRYSPLEKLSLYGSFKYEKSSPGSIATFYGGGVSADFKLLSTSLDYQLAKRDTDNRVEKKLSANVRRAF